MLIIVMIIGIDYVVGDVVVEFVLGVVVGIGATAFTP